MPKRSLSLHVVRGIGSRDRIETLVENNIQASPKDILIQLSIHLPLRHWAKCKRHSTNAYCIIFDHNPIMLSTNMHVCLRSTIVDVFSGVHQDNYVMCVASTVRVGIKYAGNSIYNTISIARSLCICSFLWDGVIPFWGDVPSLMSALAECKTRAAMAAARLLIP